MSVIDHTHVVNPIEQRQAARRDRLAKAAADAMARADQSFGRARAIGSMIPFGQPILVGHHSERRARKDANRIDASMRRGVEEAERAEELRRRADAVGRGGISSDDPEAVAKLEAELTAAREAQASYKAINDAIRRNAKAGPDAQVAALMAIGVAEATARKALVGDSLGNIGVASYKLTNNAANIRRIEKRIADLRAKAATPARDEIATDRYTIGEDVADNRTRIRFTDRPGRDVTALLKSRGFRWSPTAGSWQRQRSNGAWHAALEVARMVDDAARVDAPLDEPDPDAWLDRLDLD